MQTVTQIMAANFADSPVSAQIRAALTSASNGDLHNARAAASRLAINMNATDRYALFDAIDELAAQAKHRKASA